MDGSLEFRVDRGFTGELFLQRIYKHQQVTTLVVHHDRQRNHVSQVLTYFAFSFPLMDAIVVDPATDINEIACFHEHITGGDDVYDGGQ